VGPLRSTIDLIRVYEWSPLAERFAVWAWLLVYAVASVIIAAWLARLIRTAVPRSIRVFLLLFCLFAAWGTAILLLHPGKYELGRRTMTFYDARFTFGSYPDKELLAQLKRQGYTAVITLLDPDDLPQEKLLFDEEKRAAAEVGIPLIHLPLLPWLGGTTNERSLEQVIALAKKDEGRYYVHCYLGMDRTSLVQRALYAAVQSTTMIVTTPTGRLADAPRFERGDVIRLPGATYLTPFPTEQERLAHIINSDARMVALIFDPTDPDSAAACSAEEKLLDAYFMPTHVIPLSSFPYDPQRVLDAALVIDTLPHPLVIEIYQTNAPLAEGLIQSLRTHLPALPVSLFTEPMKTGRVGVAATNRAVGPRPSPAEFGSYLYNRGVRSFLYLGALPAVAATEDEALLRSEGLHWQAIDPSLEDPTRKTAAGGPWYLYGPKLSPLQLSTRSRFVRGPIYRLDVQAYLIPTPTPEEQHSYFRPDDVQEVLIFTQPGDNLTPLHEEQALLAGRGIAASIITLPAVYDPFAVLSGALRAWEASRPLVVQIDPRAVPINEAFRQAFFKNVPPLPPALFEPSLEGGEATVIAPNAAIGPRPTSSEFHTLYQRGVRACLFLGSASSPEAEEDRKSARGARLSWENLSQNMEALFRKTSSGGPWYLYGPEREDVQERLRARFGGPIPSRILYYPQEDWTSPFRFLQRTGGPVGIYHCTRCALGFTPDFRTLALWGPSLFLYVLFSAWLVGSLRLRKPSLAPHTRKIFHFLIFSFAGLLQATLYFPSLVLFGAIAALFIFYALCVGQGFPFYDALARPLDYPKQASLIFIPLVMTAAGGLLSYVFFGHFVIVGIFVCGWGDAIGEVVGVRWGKHAYRVPSLLGISAVRTLEGSCAVALVGAAAGVLSMAWLGYPLMLALWVGALAGLAGAVIEACSHHGLDNLSVQIAASGAAYALVQWSL
jgi:phytol kinase